MGAHHMKGAPPGAPHMKGPSHMKGLHHTNGAHHMKGVPHMKVVPYVKGVVVYEHCGRLWNGIPGLPPIDQRALCVLFTEIGASHAEFPELPPH